MIRAIGKDECIGTFTTGNGIITGTTINGVIARTRRDVVIRTRPGDLVITRTGCYIFNAGKLIIAGFRRLCRPG